MISNAKKAVIHIAKAQIGMSDEEYRDLLSSVGVESSKDLTGQKFCIIMDQFEKLGFKTTSKTRSKRNIHNLPEEKQAYMRKLEAIILDMGKSWAYVDGIAKKRFGIEKVQWLEPSELKKILLMMVFHQNRREKA